MLAAAVLVSIAVQACERFEPGARDSPSRTARMLGDVRLILQHELRETERLRKSLEASTDIDYSKAVAELKKIEQRLRDALGQLEPGK